LKISINRSGSKKIEASVKSCIALGNFDGLHLGHQELFKSLKEDSSCESVVLSFYPHPRSVLSPNPKESPFYNLITPLRARARILADLGIDRLHIIRFSKSLSKMSAEDFLENYIFSPLNPKLIVVGFDWKFGKDRGGNVSFLKEIAEKRGIEVKVIGEVRHCDEKLGASLVREELERAGVKALSNLLGHPFSFYGRIVRGDGRGHLLGFPTANILVHRQLYPKKGVYVSKATLDGTEYASITNIGQRPTFDGGSKIKVETHILDFDKQIYGSELKVALVDFLRAEMKFSGVEELKTQIKIDITEARQVLGC